MSSQLPTYKGTNNRQIIYRARHG